MVLMLWTALAWAGAVSPGDVPNPRPSGDWVVDLPDVIDARTERQINARLDALHDELGPEIAVVVVDDVLSQSPKAFATELFARWGIGDALRDDGVLVLLVVDEHRLEIEVGYGLEEVLPDPWLADMQRTAMVPLFRQDAFGGGLEGGLLQLDARLRAHADGSLGNTSYGLPNGHGFDRSTLLARQAAREQAHQAERAARARLPWLLLGGSALGLGAVLWFVRWDQRRRYCPDCDIPMVLLSDEAEDPHLDELQQLEETLGGLDWWVHECPRCGRIATSAHVTFGSSYSQCPQCQRHTRNTAFKDIVRATSTSTGRRRITEHCVHCGFHETHVHTTPKTTPSSPGGYTGGGGGGGFGGGFGGGSSGGGGVGSSW